MDEIIRVPLKDREASPVYQSADGSYKIGTENAAEKEAAERRQKEIANAYNSITEENRVNSLDIWQSARTPNNFNVRAQQALDPFMELMKKQEQNVAFFDIEALGTPEHMRKKGGLDLFAITELSFGGTTFNGKDFVKNKGQIVSMAIAPGENEYNRIKKQLNQLKKNPMMAMSQDMHRTLLDLAKYSDANKFKEITQRGKPAYTSLIGHSRVPVAGAAFTTNTIKDIEMGLHNLYTKGTNLDSALSIFQSHINKTNSKLGGYNIHAYDLPAIMGATQNAGLKNFFGKASKSSLDFYHGYSSVVKNPYELTGASTRQEHIHQALMMKGDIKPGKKGPMPSYLYHLAADDIQANIDIAGFTYNKIRSFINDAKKAPQYSLAPNAINTNPLAAGQEVFSFQSGFFDKEKHKYNLVGTLEEDGKKIAPRWANLNTSLPSNESFTVQEFLKDIALPGTDKKGYGVRLDSKDMKGKSILLMSETQEDLAQQLHGSFMPVDDAISKGLRDMKVKHDASFRQYDKMFDENGWEKMSEYYGHLNSGKADAGFDWQGHIINRNGTEELATKFPHMVPRLQAEQPIWEAVMKQLGNSGLNDKQKSVALRHIKNEFDTLGDNRAEVTAPGNKFFNFSFGKEDEMVFDAKNTEQIKNSFRSYIKGGRRGDRIGDPEKSYKVARIDEIMNLVIDNFGFSAEGKEAARVKRIAEGMKNEVFSGNKIETALTSMSNLVRDHVEIKGNGSFIREVTNKVTDKRTSAISALTKSLPSVIDDSINHAHSLSEAKTAINDNTPLKKFLNQQDKYIQELFSKNFGLQGMSNPDNIGNAGRMASKYEDLMAQILGAYSNDFNTQVRFMEGGNPLLVLADKKSGMDLSSVKTYEELMKNPKIAAIELPHFDEDLKVRYGSNRKASVIRSGIDKKGKGYHSTSVTDALNMVLNYSKSAKEMAEFDAAAGNKDTFIKIRQGIRFQVGKQVDPVPTDPHRKLDFDDREMFDIKSSIGGEVRSSKWDVSGYAEAWYRQNASGLGLTTPADKIAERAKTQGVSFYEAMNQRAKSYAQAGGLLDFANGYSGLKGSIFGINNRAASQGYVGTAGADARMFMALGNYYSDSVENPHKTTNYRKIDAAYAEKALESAGRNQSYRTQNSFISSEAQKHLAKNKEIRGITVQSGYMTDNEIADQLKDADRIAKYKSMIDKADLSPIEKRQMKKSLDMGMLSTSDGLSFMDHRLMQAFNGQEEIRVNMKADDVTLHNSIEQAIEKEAQKQGLGDGKWKQQGITFEKPLQFDINPLLNEKDQATLGKYTINNIHNKIVEDTAFRKGDKVSILGFNADGVNKKSLVLGRGREVGHGLKLVTEGSVRTTTVPMLKEIIDDLYGAGKNGSAGVEQIIAHLPSKKGATDLPSLIRGYDTQIRQQFDGTATKNLKGFTKVEDALESFYSDVEKMGIKTVNNNGQYVVDSGFGLNNEKLLYEANSKSGQFSREQLSQKWMGKLGLNREVFAEIDMAHAVWDRQGGKDRGRITTKELDMLDRSYMDSKIYKPGEQSAHAKWMRSAVYGDLSTPEVKAQRKVFEDVVRAAGNFENGWTPKAGDAVIDYTTDGVAALNNMNAKMKDGVLHVSKDSFEKIPGKAGHDQVLTVGDYNKTVVNAGQMDYSLENGKTGKVQNFLMQNKGTAYMKLPEFASNQYVPLIDVDSMKLPGDIDYKEKEEFLDTVKSHYANIAKKTDEYNGMFVTETLTEKMITDRRRVLAEQIDGHVSGLKTTMGAATSGEGMKKFLSRRMEMSSQYQFGGVNPALAYQKKGDKWVNNGIAKEGEIYMNPKDVRNLIGDKAENIAKSWGDDISDVSTLGIKRRKKEKDEAYKLRAQTEYVMNNWNKNDVFSTTIRYPSISAGTTQALKVKVSDAVGIGQVVGMRGGGERINGDYDGDNLAVFLSHYGIEDEEQRSAVLKDISKLHDADTAKNNLWANDLMTGIEEDFRNNVSIATKGKLAPDHEDVMALSKQFFSAEGVGKNVTLGSMHGDDALNVVQEALRSSGKHDTWGTSKNGNGELADLEHETSLLRVGTANSIGSVDNTRMRMSGAFKSIAEAKYKRFNGAEGAARYSQDDFLREKTQVEEFLREFSQKSISAKKVEGSNPTESLGELFTLLDDINNPSGQKVDLDLTAERLVDRGLFKDRPYLNIGKEGEFYQGSKHDYIKSSLSILADAEETLQEAGYSGGFREISLSTGSSRGNDFKGLSNMIRHGEYIPGMDAITETAEIAKSQGHERMVQAKSAFEEKIAKIHERRSANISNRLDDANNTDKVMSSGSVSQSRILGNDDMPVHRTIRDSIDDSFSELASSAKHAFGGSMGKIAGVAGAGLAGIFATNALMKGAPTPEGLQEMAPVSPDVMTTPTARVTPNQNGEYINIAIKAKAAQTVNSNDLAAMINNEVMGMSKMQMNTNVNVKDNSQNIDKNWLEGAIANSMNKGYAY